MEHTMHVLKNENESDDEPESEVIDEPLVDHQHCQNLVTEQDSVNLPFTEATADELKTKINHDVESVYVKEESSLDCILESSKPEMTSNQREDLLTEYNAIQSACYKEGDADDIDREEELTFKKEPMSDDEDNEVLAVRIKQRWQHCQNTWKQPSSETEITSGQEEEEEEEEEDPMSEHDAVESMSKNVLMDNTRKKKRTKIKEEPVSDDEGNTNGPQTVVEPVLILKIKERWQHCQSAWTQQPSETEMTSGPEEDPLSEQSSVQSVNLKEEVPSNTSEEMPEVIRPPTAVFIKQESNKVLSDGAAYNKQYYLITKGPEIRLVRPRVAEIIRQRMEVLANRPMHRAIVRAQKKTIQLAKDRERRARRRAKETPMERLQRQAKDRVRNARYEASLTQEKRLERLARARERRALETEEKRRERLARRQQARERKREETKEMRMKLRAVFAKLALCKK